MEEIYTEQVTNDVMQGLIKESLNEWREEGEIGDFVPPLLLIDGYSILTQLSEDPDPTNGTFIGKVIVEDYSYSCFIVN